MDVGGAKRPRRRALRSWRTVSAIREELGTRYGEKGNVRRTVSFLVFFVGDLVLVHPGDVGEFAFWIRMRVDVGHLS